MIQPASYLVRRPIAGSQEFVRVDQPVEGETIYHGEFVEWQRPLPEEPRPRGYSGLGDDTTHDPSAPPEPKTATVFLPVDPEKVTGEVYKPEVTITVF